MRNTRNGFAHLGNVVTDSFFRNPSNSVVSAFTRWKPVVPFSPRHTAEKSVTALSMRGGPVVGSCPYRNRCHPSCKRRKPSGGRAEGETDR